MIAGKEKFAIIGDSHVYPLASAAKQLVPEAKKKDLHGIYSLSAATDFYMKFHSFRGEKIYFLQDKMKERLKGLLDADGALRNAQSLLWVISLGTHTSTFLSINRWRSHRLWSVSGCSDKQPVSSAVFREMMIDLNKHILAFLADMLAAGCRVAVISAPPPTRRFHLLKSGYSEDDLLRVDREARDAVADQIKAMGIDIVEPPAIVSEGGFLKAEYLSDDEKDVHHGNIQYSKLMLEDVFRFARTLPTEGERFCSSP